MGTVAIVGLEQDVDVAQSQEVLRRLKTARLVIVPSRDTALARYLAGLGISFVTLEELDIDARASFADVASQLLEKVGSADATAFSASPAGVSSPIDDIVLVWGSEASRPIAQPLDKATSGSFEELMALVGVLRGPDGCPWDREQTHESLAAHLIEESYETVAAIESGDRMALAEELGDVLLQVVLHAQIGAAEGAFTIDDVLSSIISKILRRHPHVFGTASADTAEEVTRVWDAVKREEKPHAGVLGEVPPAMPALMRAQKISRRAASAGFEWDDLAGVWAKVQEEIAELRACTAGSPESVDELGDVLFTLVHVARKMDIDAESALRTTCERFAHRFSTMEQEAAARALLLPELVPDEWNDLWEHAKLQEKARAECFKQRRDETDELHY